VIDVTLYTDPACPFAFSAEPARLRLRWHYGDGLHWQLKMIVLTLEPGEAEKLAGGASGLQARFGMPIHPFPYPRAASSEPACRAVVATRLNAPGSEHRLLRALRVRTMSGGLLDDPELIVASAVDAGLHPDELRRWSQEAATEEALAQDIQDARHPSPAARALDHKLGGPAGQRRYTAPSYELRNGSASVCLPGFNPVEAYEAAIANLDLLVLLQEFARDVQRQVAGIDHALDEAQVQRQELLGVVHDEHAPHVQLKAARGLALEPQLADLLEQSQRLVGGAGIDRLLYGGVVELGIAEMVAAALVDVDPAGLAQAIDAERRQERVQDAGVIGVLDVLEIELPVVGQNLRRAADDVDRAAVEHALEPADHDIP